MKHPGPWRHGATDEFELGIVDATGSPVLSPVSNAITEIDDIHFASPEAARLILAAPELLAALKALVAGMDYDKGMGAYDEAVALIDRIENDTKGA